MRKFTLKRGERRTLVHVGVVDIHRECMSSRLQAQIPAVITFSNQLVERRVEAAYLLPILIPADSQLRDTSFKPRSKAVPLCRIHDWPPRRKWVGRTLWTRRREVDTGG
jgi:hypothetical protein